MVKKEYNLKFFEIQTYDKKSSLDCNDGNDK